MSVWRLCRVRCRALVAALVLAAALPATAHQASDAYLSVELAARPATLRWDIALRDLDAALPALDADGDRRLTWDEVQAAWPAIDALALDALTVPGCRWQVTGHALERRQDGTYAVLHLAAPCTITATTPWRYRLFATLDATHRGLLHLREADGHSLVRVLDPRDAAGESSPATTAAVTAEAATGPTLAAAAPPPAGSLFREGLHHILSGYDHLLFLLCLLLPTVLRRERGRWHAVDQAGQAWRPVVATVTLFTLAHSVTLALATLGVVQLAPRIVEPAIAVTIMLAALDNLRPLIGRWRGVVTFVFGLIHGFGFAGALQELSLSPGALAWSLLQFNLGIEAGQLALVALTMPLLLRLRRLPLYVPGVVVTGSSAALLMAAVWLVERSTEWRMLPA